MEVATVRDLTLTVPFVNFAWRSDLFDFSVGADVDQKPSLAVSERAVGLLADNRSRIVQSDVVQGLLRQVDKFLPRLTNVKARSALGLVRKEDMVGDGYGVTRKFGSRFADIFVCCVAVDRILSHVDSIENIRIRQARHPYSRAATPAARSDARHFRQLENLRGACAPKIECEQLGALSKGFLDEDTPMDAQVAGLTVLSTVTAGTGHINTVMSNILLVANVLLVLANGRSVEFIDKVLARLRATIATQEIAQQIQEIFIKSNFRKLRYVYTAITGSILDILDPRWQHGKLDKESAGSKITVSEFLKHTGDEETQIPARILMAESAIWKIIFETIERHAEAMKALAPSSSSDPPSSSNPAPDQSLVHASAPPRESSVVDVSVYGYLHAQTVPAMEEGLIELLFSLRRYEECPSAVVVHDEFNCPVAWPDITEEDEAASSEDEDAELHREPHFECMPAFLPTKRSSSLAFLDREGDLESLGPPLKRIKISEDVSEPAADASETNAMDVDAQDSDDGQGDADLPVARDGQDDAEPQVARDGQEGAEVDVASDGQEGAEVDVASDGQEGAEVEVASDGQGDAHMDGEEATDRASEDDGGDNPLEDMDMAEHVPENTGPADQDYADEGSEDDTGSELGDNNDQSGPRRSSRLAKKKNKGRYPGGGRISKKKSKKRRDGSEREPSAIYESAIFIPPEELQDGEKLVAVLDQMQQEHEKLAPEPEPARIPKLFDGTKAMRVKYRDVSLSTLVSHEGQLACEMVNFRAPWYTDTPNSFAAFNELAKHTGLTNASEINADSSGTRAYAREAINQLTREELCEAFAEKDLHILPAGGAINEETFSEKTCKQLGIDMGAARIFHENRYLDDDDLEQKNQMRSGTLRDLFSVSAEDEKRVDVNCLTILLTNGFGQTPSLIHHLTLSDHAFSAHSSVPVDWRFLAWALVTTAPARTTPHFDAGRHATWVQVLTGTKIFFIRDDETYLTPSERCAVDPLQHTWTPVVLRAGHTLIMRPGREHMVYTLEDSVARGGHFYCHSTLRLSFLTAIREALHGGTSTNDVYLTAETVLYRILSRYLEEQIDANRRKTRPPFGQDADLAALILMNLYPNLLEPQQPDSEKGSVKEEWGWAHERRRDREQARSKAYMMLAYNRGLLEHVASQAKTMSYLKQVAEAAQLPQ